MRLLKLLLVLLACAAGPEVAPPLSAQTLQPGWIVDAKTRCRVWNANPEPGETISWTGGCQNTLAQGRGVLQWFKDGKPNGRFDGEYRDGKRNGRGVETSASGNRYDGEYRDDKRSGRGVYTSTAGGRYDGEYRDGKQSGRGAITWPNGNRYDGEWRDGMQSGRGVFTWPSGNRYDGEWRDGKANGTGTLTRTDGQTYSGIWTKGCFKQGSREASVGATGQECGFR